MITEPTALKYKQELHPAFAGYLHDGAISNRDQLASIFALADYGSIDFIYEDNNLTKPIKTLRKTNINSIKESPLNEDNLKFGNKKNIKINFNVNGVEINSLVKANQAKSSIVAISLSFGIIGIFFLAGSIMFKGLPQMTLMGFIFLTVSITTWLSFFKSQKYVSFDLPNNIKDYKEKYTQLYEFLKISPLNRRKLSDEFLAYDIAFGLN